MSKNISAPKAQQWRSEPIEYVELILPEDSCRETLFELGELGCVQFIDENEVSL